MNFFDSAAFKAEMRLGMSITKPTAHAAIRGPAYSTTIEEEMAKLEEHHPDEAVNLKHALYGEWTDA